jgi:isopenicillin N synthase-like dioxygenase
MNLVPTIDLTAARAGNRQDKERTAAEIAKACEEIGFMIITGHGVNSQVIANVYKNMNQFFKLPITDKEKFIGTAKYTTYEKNGYVKLLSENAYAGRGIEGMPNDCSEAFNMNTDILHDDVNLPFSSDNFGRNFRQDLKLYFEACIDFSEILAELIEISVKLPNGFFGKNFSQSRDYMRLIQYPGFENTLPHKQGLGEHTDGGLFTLISCIGGSGLEIKTRQGKWISVKTENMNQFCVNIGDSMMRLSNDKWISTEHRVVLSHELRQSIAFFKTLNDDVVVEPLPEFCKTIPKKYKPVVFGEFQKSSIHDKGDVLSSNS